MKTHAIHEPEAGVLSALAEAVEKHPVASSAPGVAATAWTFVTGLPLNDVIAVLTVVWLALQILAVVWARVSRFINRKETKS